MNLLNTNQHNALFRPNHDAHIPGKVGMVPCGFLPFRAKMWLSTTTVKGGLRIRSMRPWQGLADAFPLPVNDPVMRLYGAFWHRLVRVLKVPNSAHLSGLMAL